MKRFLSLFFVFFFFYLLSFSVFACKDNPECVDFKKKYEQLKPEEQSALAKEKPNLYLKYLRENKADLKKNPKAYETVISEDISILNKNKDIFNEYLVSKGTPFTTILSDFTRYDIRTGQFEPAGAKSTPFTLEHISSLVKTGYNGFAIEKEGELIIWIEGKKKGSFIIKSGEFVDQKNPILTSGQLVYGSRLDGAKPRTLDLSNTKTAQLHFLPSGDMELSGNNVKLPSDFVPGVTNEITAFISNSPKLIEGRIVIFTDPGLSDPLYMLKPGSSKHVVFIDSAGSTITANKEFSYFSGFTPPEKFKGDYIQSASNGVLRIRASDSNQILVDLADKRVSFFTKKSSGYLLVDISSEGGHVTIKEGNFRVEVDGNNKISTQRGIPNLPIKTGSGEYVDFVSGKMISGYCESSGCHSVATIRQALAASYTLSEDYRRLQTLVDRGSLTSEDALELVRSDGIFKNTAGIRLLSQFADDEHIRDVLKSLLGDRRHRSQAIIAAGLSKRSEFSQPLIDILKISERHLEQAVLALGRIGDENAIDFLRNKITDDTSKRDIKAIVRSIAMIGGSKAFNALKNSVDVGWNVRSELFVGIVQLANRGFSDAKAHIVSRIELGLDYRELELITAHTEDKDIIRSFMQSSVSRFDQSGFDRVMGSLEKQGYTPRMKDAWFLYEQRNNLVLDRRTLESEIMMLRGGVSHTFRRDIEGYDFDKDPPLSAFSLPQLNKIKYFMKQLQITDVIKKISNQISLDRNGGPVQVFGFHRGNVPGWYTVKSGDTEFGGRISGANGMEFLMHKPKHAGDKTFIVSNQRTFTKLSVRSYGTIHYHALRTDSSLKGGPSEGDILSAAFKGMDGIVATPLSNGQINFQFYTSEGLVKSLGNYDFISD